MHINREAGYVEIDAKVVNRDADWLELLVCVPGSREYESILSSPAKPSHIHLALLMLGLKPGQPLDWKRTDDGFAVQPPKGPRIAVFCRWQENGEQHEAPANTWVERQDTGKVMAGNHWLFAGSAFHESEGKRLYMADLNGTVISLVNFGDDLLTRPTTTTNRDDARAWATHTKAIPPEGTPVTLRLVPMAQNGEGAGQDTTGGTAATTQPAASQPAATEPAATEPANTPPEAPSGPEGRRFIPPQGLP